MKKAILIVFLLHILCLFQVFAQDFCLTSGNFPNSLGNMSTQFISNTGPYSVRVFFHIVRRTDGTGGQNPNVVNTAFDNLCYDFEFSNIKFSLLGEEDIKNDDLFDYNYTEPCGVGYPPCDYEQLFATNPHSNAIDIYILPSNVLNGGVSNGIPGTALVVGGSFTKPGWGINLATTSVVSHEMGHCLGLFHTFHGTLEKCTQVNESCCSEHAVNNDPTRIENGVLNGEKCGDFVLDTPADPIKLFYENLGSNCTWNNTSLEDQFGDLYNPDETLIMSYTYPQCMSRFSEGQNERMRTTIATSPILQARIVPNDIFVQDETFYEGEHRLEAINSIVAGVDVIVDEPVGNVNIQYSAIVEFCSHNLISLQPGVVITPDPGGRFFTTIINDQALKSANVNKSDIVDNYHPFLNNSTWYSVGQGFEGYDNYVYFTEKDTTFNGFSYSKINLKFVELPEAWGDHNSRGSNFFVREDIPNKRVYRYFRGTGDVLLYDFGLEVGDLLPQNTEYLLVNIDSLDGADGSKKRFTFKKDDENIIICIEGVGNISSPFIPDAILWDAHKLICASQNGVNTYSFTNKDGITCNSFEIVLASSDVKSITPVRIYPNPTKGVFRIVFNETLPQKKIIQILDINGKIISTVGEFEGLNHLDIDISTLPIGLYFCVINSGNKTTSFKIIKQ